MSYLLDTNICVGMMKGNRELCRAVWSFRPSQIVVPSVVRAELHYGAQKSDYPVRNRKAVQSLLEPYASLPFDDAAAEQYGALRARMERAGTPVGSHDLMIASIALVHDLTVVTRNHREYARIIGLRTEQW